MSGGRATVHRKAGRAIEHVAGDICAVHDAGAPLVRDFFIEAKFYRDLNLSGFVLERTGLLMDFWLTAYDEATQYEKLPLLICRQNRRSTFVGLTHLGTDYLRLSINRRALFTIPRLDLVVMPFTYMLSRPYPV